MGSKPGCYNVELNRDVTFHEEVSFKFFKELRCDLDMEEHETPMMENLYFGSPHPDIERENPEESLDSLSPEEPVELFQKSLDEPPAKRRSSCCRDILQGAEKNGAPLRAYRT